MNTDTPHQLFRRLLEFMDELRQESIQHAAPTESAREISPRQMAVISQLHQMQEEQPQGVSLKSLAGRMQMTVPACSLLVEALVCKNCVQRTINPNNRRSVQLTLTESGKTLIENIYAHFHCEIDKRAKALTPGELSAFSRLVLKMTKK